MVSVSAYQENMETIPFPAIYTSYIPIVFSSSPLLSMATPTPPVRTCVLRVWIKCCKGCQTKAKTKLLTVSGVSGVEYNAEQGLLTVSGNANPETLLRKLSKWGKTAELVSVLGDITGSVPQHPQTKTMWKKRPTKCCLLRCFGKPSSKTKVQPCRGAWAENATAVSPPMVYPPPAMPAFASPIPYPPPCFGASQPPPPPYSTAAMFRPPPPQSPPYFQTQFPLMVHSRLHYPPLR